MTITVDTNNKKYKFLRKDKDRTCEIECVGQNKVLRGLITSITSSGKYTVEVQEVIQEE